MTPSLALQSDELCVVSATDALLRTDNPRKLKSIDLEQLPSMKIEVMGLSLTIKV